MTTELQVRVNQDAPRAAGEEALIDLKGTKRGEACVIDFYTAMALEQNCFQVRAGSVTTPLVGDVVITTLAAEMTADAALGLTMIPTYFNIGIRLYAATLLELGLKSVGAVSTAGTAFVPLPVYMGGKAAQTTGRVAAAGGCTISNDVVTTTRVIYQAANAIAAGAFTTTFTYKARLPHVLVGPACLYVVAAADTTGPSYYAAFEYIELSSSVIG